MREEARTIRQQQIEQAAYAVLEDKGYAGTSMLAIARKARASNETLYSWYGDKIGLFKALVARNASESRMLLEERINAESDALDTLRAFGPMLLGMLTGARAVALNRAAAADPSGDLGRAISTEGRETIGPLVAKVLLQARDKGRLGFSDPGEALELYFGLLIGDLQIRRVIGRATAPSKAERERRSERTVQALLRLLPP
jgi:AcrR family transcriptional regulator